MGIQGGLFSSNDAAYYSQLQVGFMGTASNRQGTSAPVKEKELQVDYSLDYGMPGKD